MMNTRLDIPHFLPYGFLSINGCFITITALHHDTPDGSEESLPPSYTTSILCPGVKRTQPETGHRKVLLWIDTNINGI